MISATQLKMYLQCPQKWFFRYVERIKTPPHEGAELGKRVHEQLAKMLQGEVPDDPEAYQIALKGVHLLPDSVEAVEIQFVHDGFVGVIDFVGDKFFGDHKTTKDVRYALTPEELEWDPQCTLYAMAVMDLLSLDEVVAKWIYYPTKDKKRGDKVIPAKAKETWVLLTRAEVTERWGALVQLADEMRAVEKRSLPVVKDYAGCWEYGACPYMGRCLKGEYERTMAAVAKREVECDVETTEEAA